MDSPPSKKAKGDTSPTPSNPPEKGEIETLHPASTMQSYDKGDCRDMVVIQNHTRAFKLDKSKSFKSKRKEKFDKKCAQHDDILWKIFQKIEKCIIK